MIFFVGLHQVVDARRVDRACISINRLRDRRSLFAPPRVGWMLDSGAFTEISCYGGYRHPPGVFVREAARFLGVPGLQGVVSQDFMCEPAMLARTGLTVAQHQVLTIRRYEAIRDLWDGDGVPIMPVLQGWTLGDYVEHVRLYGDLLEPGAWVGVGSVCKRQGDVSLVENILGAILDVRPDLRLHGFGVKLTALQSPVVRKRLYSADSMAWSYSARRQGRDGNDWQEAAAFAQRVAGPS